MTETEQQLEAKLLRQLNGLGYESVDIDDIDSLKENLKKQIEKHNNITLSVVSHLMVTT